MVAKSNYLPPDWGLSIQFHIQIQSNIPIFLNRKNKPGVEDPLRHLLLQLSRNDHLKRFSEDEGSPLIQKYANSALKFLVVFF